MAIDEAKLNELLNRALVDLGAIGHGALLVIGDKLGLYKALAASGPLTAEELARKTGTAERYVREWLNSQAAGGYVTYDPSSSRYSMTEEQALCLAQNDSPAFLPGGFQAFLAAIESRPRIEENFRSGEGLGWHEHHHELFEGTERFFRPNYAAHLVSEWIPALEGVKEKLEAGARVADVGCGHGASTILMAQAFPRSSFTGFDYHEPSIRAAREAARRAEVDDRVEFAVAKAKDYPGTYDFVAFFDCLHDMGDPQGAAGHVRGSLADGGTWMVVEPYASDRVEENLNPIGRAFYSISTFVCTPASLAQEVGLALGAQAGEQRIRDVVTKAGFSSFRRAAETPFNLVFEAKP